MSDSTGRRTNIPSDPTAERTSDPVPTGRDVIDSENPGNATPHNTPRRYEQPVDEDPALPSNDATLNTRI